MVASGTPFHLCLTDVSPTVANQDTTLIEPPSSEPPILKGYLNKYTNVARGYGTRWFVLNNGVLSCRSPLCCPADRTNFDSIDYRHQEDETVASRGSIAMKTATLKVPATGEKLRFEVQSAPSRGHQSSGVQKWYMKANHPVEASRWTQAIAKSIEHSKRDGALDPAEQARRASGESDSSAMTKGHAYRTSISTFSPRRQDSNFIGVGDSLSSLPAAGDDDRGSPAMQDNSPDGGDHSRDDSSVTESTGKVPPHDSTFDLQGNSTAAQMELTSQLLANISLPNNTPGRTQKYQGALKESFTAVHGMINEYIAMAKERDDWWRQRLQRELARQAVWEESLQTVVKEGEVLERELRMRSRKRGSRFFDVSEAGGSTLRNRTSLHPRQQASVPEEDYFPPHAAKSAQTPDSSQYVTVKTPTSAMGIVASPSVITPTPERRQPAMPSPGMRGDDYDADTAQDTDEEDEFFDAIESGTLPIDVHELLSSPLHSERKTSSMFLEPYVAYKQLREQLPIAAERPSTSLWSVLKHSIGKDLTKISFPVFFNEPTSMLQRMVSL